MKIIKENIIAMIEKHDIDYVNITALDDGKVLMDIKLKDKTNDKK